MYICMCYVNYEFCFGKVSLIQKNRCITPRVGLGILVEMVFFLCALLHFFLVVGYFHNLRLSLIIIADSKNRCGLRSGGVVAGVKACEDSSRMICSLLNSSPTFAC